VAQTSCKCFRCTKLSLGMQLHGQEGRCARLGLLIAAAVFGVYFFFANSNCSSPLVQFTSPASIVLRAEHAASQSATTIMGNPTSNESVPCNRLCPTCEEFCVPGNPYFFHMLKDCGHVCKLVHDGQNVTRTAGKYFDEFRKKVDCQTIWSSPYMDVPHEGEHPPSLKDLPAPLVDLYSYGGIVGVKDHYLDSKYYGSKHSVGGSVHSWTQNLIDDLVAQALNHSLKGGYGYDSTNCLEAGLRAADLHGKHVLVIGSEKPWVEALCLANGAAQITTLEYASLESSHTLVHVMTPSSMSIAARTNKLPQFDVIVSFSSIEHSGLGRYGDAVNPYGDLITTARAWCLASPEARLVLGVPTVGLQHDKPYVSFNEARHYGKTTYAQLFANWKQDTMHPCRQTVFQLQKLPAI